MRELIVRSLPLLLASMEDSSQGVRSAQMLKKNAVTVVCSRCDACAWDRAATSVDNLTLILSGLLRLTDESGSGPVEFGAGELVFVPKGWAGRWEVLEPSERLSVELSDLPTSEEPPIAIGLATMQPLDVLPAAADAGKRSSARSHRHRCHRPTLTLPPPPPLIVSSQGTRCLPLSHPILHCFLQARRRRGCCGATDWRFVLHHTRIVPQRLPPRCAPL